MSKYDHPPNTEESLRFSPKNENKFVMCLQENRLITYIGLTLLVSNLFSIYKQDKIQGVP